MKHLDYEIEHFRPEHRSEAVGVLGQLLGEGETENDAYFSWKYEQNPHAKEPLGIVALQRGKVVAFRGYAVSLWRTGPSNTMRVLIPGDTCVDQEHRKKGLSVAMGNLARTDYAEKYPLLLNLSCTRASLPGYLRLGFAPISNKVYLSSYRLAGLARYVLDAKKQLPLAAADIAFGRFGDARVAAEPSPGVMASIVEKQEQVTDRFRLCQDADYFRWRFNGPSDRFIFYFLERHGAPVAYLVLGIAPSNRRAYVMDYADIDGKSSSHLLEFAVRRHDFSVISIFAHSTDPGLEPALRRMKFHEGGIMGAMEKKVRGNMPLLVRPICTEPVKEDWIINGSDIRDPGNWAIRGICSDAT